MRSVQVEPKQVQCNALSKKIHTLSAVTIHVSALTYWFKDENIILSKLEVEEDFRHMESDGKSFEEFFLSGKFFKILYIIYQDYMVYKLKAKPQKCIA